MCSCDSPDTEEPFVFRAWVADRHGSISLQVDGVEAVRVPTGFELTGEYPDYATALAAPPRRLETRLGGAVIDTLVSIPGSAREPAASARRSDASSSRK
jgi:hypothetical protein